MLRAEVWRARLDEAIAAALVGGRALAVALVDVDGFARHQDELETDRADALLEALAGRLGQALPARTLGRLGGDLFAVILSDTEVEEAMTELGEARQQVLKTSFKVGRGVRRREVRPTLSVGLAGLRRDGRSAPEVIERAESALFRAKTLGGDRLALPSSERMTLKSSYYPQETLDRLKQLAARQGVKEAVLLREALGDLLLKYKGQRPQA
ncbi:MAG: diguanylate cyclase [Planctomycetota bacterium]